MYRKALLLTVMSVFAFLLLFSAGSNLYAQTDEGATDPYYEEYENTGEEPIPTLYDEQPTLYDEYDDEYEELYDDWYLDDGTYANEDFPWAIFIMAFICIFLPFYVFSAVVLSTLGKKLGVSGGWMAWVPILNMYYMVKLAGLPGWTFLLFLVPFVNAIYQIYIWMKIAGRRGFEEWMGLLTIVPIANFIFMVYITWSEPKVAVNKPEGDAVVATQEAKVEDVKVAEVKESKNKAEGDK